MRTTHLGSTGLVTSRLALGCMRLGGTWDAAAPITAQERERALATVRAALDVGFTCFDHADIYCAGKSESLIADVLSELGVPRSRLTVISKCGIRWDGGVTRYDFSYDWMIASVEGSLRRLRTDHLDLLLLHRPDPLVEPAEVARAIDRLVRDGKILTLGVSNHTAGQMQVLQRALPVPIAVNQIELSLVRHEAISAGILANQGRPGILGVDGLIDHCRLHGITLQAWSPLAGGALGDTDRTAPALRAALVEAGKRHGVSAEAIALAWLLRHPAGIQPVIGTTDAARVRALAEADRIDLSHAEWYALLAVARGEKAP